MPFIHIKSLPLDIDPEVTLPALTADFAAATGIAGEHITITWTWLQPGHYAVAGDTGASRPSASHPLLVDLLAPDFNDATQVETMLSCLARSLAAHCGLSADSIFINYREARSGAVFDDGEIVRW